ncbi:TPA: polymorphic toxin MafB class 1, partial [Neisseria meningitidis]
NPFISAGEALGIGDILYGTRYAIDKAAMRNIAPLPAEGKFAVIGGLGSVAGFEKNTREAVDRWIQENPNAAETVEALVNVLPFAKVKNLTKAAKPGKAAVSGDFSAAYNTRTTRKVTTETEGLNRIRQNQKNSNIHEKNYGRDNPNHINVLSGNSIQHILYGDEAGGGHLFPGKPGKTTFPQHWSASKITHEISDIVTSPKTQWYAQTGTGGKYIAKGRPARWVSYETRDGIRIRTVYEPATGKVVTAFPDRTSNPKYNPVK